MAVATMGNASRRVATQQDREQRQREKEQDKAQREMIKELRKEAQIRGQLLTNCLTRLGQAHMPRSADISTNGKAVKKHKISRVKFSMIFTSPERFWYKLLINKRGVFGYKDMLPFGVYTRDLISPDTVFELSQSCGCVVTAFADPHHGVWYVVDRLKGMDGLPQYVGFRDVFPYYPEDMSTAPVLLGIGEHRKTHFIDFATHPHWLIGGSSNGGKSNLVNHIISSLMRLTHPDDLRFVLIDLKELEFTYYKNSAHLEGEIIVNSKDAITALESLLEEMNRRKHLLSGKAKELSMFNKKYPDQKLPRIILVIDEFAELMLASGTKVAKEIARLTTRITNLGRAVGLHLIIATQRPDKSVLPRSIRVNMPLIVAARVPSGYDSLVIIGSYDAASLPLHPGRMIYQSGSQRHIIQTPHIQDDDVLEAVKISNGRKLGLIAMNGYQPTISPEYVVQFIFDMCGGSLSLEKLYKELDPYAVPRAELKALVADIINDGRVSAFDRLYEVEKHGNGLRLVMLYSDDSQARQTTPDFNFDTERTLKRLTAGGQLMLPAPKVEPQTRSDSETELPGHSETRNTRGSEMPDVITVTAIPVDLTYEETIRQFIKDSCTQSKTSRSTAKKLLERYRSWCSERDYEAASHRRFGEQLRALGFTPFQGTSGVRCWRGIELLNNETQDSAVA